MDIYKIGMSITLANGVSSVLGIIAQDMFKLEGGVKKLQSAMGSLNRTSLAVGGALGVVAGGAILAGFAKLTDKAKELSHQLVQIKKLGVDPGDFEKYRDAAYRAHSQVPGATSVDALKTLGMTHSMFGVEGSIRALKPILEFAQALGNSSGDYEKATEQVKEMVRAGELSGQFVNESTHKVDVEKLLKFLDLGQKANAATHGMVNPHTWLMMAQQGGPMLGTMSEEGMLTMAMIGQAMGGPRAGTALQAVGRQFLGFKMTTPTADALDSIGFMKQDMYTDKMGRLRNKYTTNKGLWSKEGGPFSETGTAFARATQDDPLSAAMILLKALNEHGYKSMKEIVPMLYQILGTDTARRIEHEMIRNAPQMFDEKGRVKAGLGVSAANKVQNAEDYEQVLHNYEAAKNEMLMHIGLPLMQTAIPFLKKMTEFFDWLGDFAKAHPDDIANIGKGFAILGAALIGGGGAALLAALGPVGWFATGIIALGAAFVTFKDKLFGLADSIARLIPSASEAVAAMNQLGNLIKGFFGGIIEWFKNKIGGLFGGGVQNQSYDGGGGGYGAQLIRASLGGSGAANDNGAFRAMTGDGSGNFAGAVASAESVVGATAGSATLQRYLATGGVGMDSSTTAWCAGFINAALAHAGIKGTGSLAAGSFANWGSAVNGGSLMAGDIIGHGKGFHGHTWGHVMMATGRHRGGLWEVIEGNSGHRVKHDWINPDNEQFIRRGQHVSPYVKPHDSKPQMIQVNLDGEVIHRSVVKHARRATEHSHQAPTFDGHHDYSAPDGQIWAA